MTDVFPALRVESVSARLGDRQVIERVSLDVDAGDLVGLIGPNGAGKTTLLRCILSLIPVGVGRVLINGQAPGRVRGQVGYVPQRHEFAWDFPISVEGTVMTGRTRMIGLLRRPGRDDREAVYEALERAGIAELRRRPIGELSGGQRQRVLIARALALRPSVLLLDEPFTGVDVPAQEQLASLLDRLRHEGQAVLMTTHDLPAASRACNRIVLLNRTVIAAGPPEELLRDPESWLRAFGVQSSDYLLASMGGHG